MPHPLKKHNVVVQRNDTSGPVACLPPQQLETYRRTSELRRDLLSIFRQLQLQQATHRQDYSATTD